MNMNVKTLIASSSRPARGNGWIVALVAVGVVLILEVATSNKVSFYLDALDRTNILYLVPLVSLLGLFLILEFPQLPLHLMAFLLPFNIVGGYWGSDMIVLLAKIAMNALVAAALVATFMAPSSDRAWLTRSKLGLATLAWLGAILMGIAVGFFSAPNREYWVRESGWMLFFAAALPFGTLIRDRRDIARLLQWLCVGIGVLQLFAFWTVATGARFERVDAWAGGATFFRAPFTVVSLFALYLAAAALLCGTSARIVSRRKSVVLFATIALLGGGLLASMVRSLWIAGTAGMAVLLFLVPWSRRTVKAAAAVGIGAILALGIVVAVDHLSPASSGQWTSSAVTFFMDLGSKDSTSVVTRGIEASHAIDVWKRSPFVGLGFGYAYPHINYFGMPDATMLDAFFMHNSYLNVLAKVGAFGLAALLYLLFRVFADARAILIRDDAVWPDRILATALAASVASLAVLTATMPVLTAGDPEAYLGMLVGLTVALRRVQPRAQL